MTKAKKPFKGYNKKKHSRTGGLNDKYRKKINREEGSNLKRPVTGKVKQGSKAAKRRKSFCSRMAGVKGPTSKDGQLTPKGAALKRWKCRKSLQKSDLHPKQKLAMFLREHLDNKLALKAAEPTITKSQILTGGKGDTKNISDFDAKEVEMGMKVELEHTKDINIAKEIVADHLSEDPSYYSKLKGSGLADELEKGLKGDWEKEGYTISHKKSPHGGIYVQAHDRHGKLAGFASIGYHDWDNAEDSEGVPVFSKTPTDHIMSFETEVEPAHQRKGLASAMYQYAEQYYGVPMEMGSLSDDAAKLWKQPRRPFGKSTLEKAGRCWEGYEPTPGKKPYSKGSCRKIKKSEHQEKDSKIKTKQLNKNYVLNGDKMQKSYHQKLIKALKCKCKEKELKKSISAMAIESGEYQGEPLDSHHHNRIGNEYRGMAKQAHIEGNRHKAREYHEKALMHFRKADEMGFQEEEPLEKKISSKLAATGLGLASAVAGLTGISGKTSEQPAKPLAVESTQTPATAMAPSSPSFHDKYVTVSSEASQRLNSLLFGKNSEDKFLHNIMQAESTGGKDINHPPITDKKSMHYGTTAFGYWALMPLTVQEIAGRYARQGGKDPRILKIPQMSKHDVNDWLAKNPDVELEIARTLARHVTSRFGNTPKAAYAWKYGHNKKDISEEEALKDTYVQKFKDLSEGKTTELTRGLIPSSKAFSGLK
jgi:GNAT superfamily N-acetyltransferase